MRGVLWSRILERITNRGSRISWWEDTNQDVLLMKANGWWCCLFLFSTLPFVIIMTSFHFDLCYFVINIAVTGYCGLIMRFQRWQLLQTSPRAVQHFKNSHAAGCCVFQKVTQWMGFWLFKEQPYNPPSVCGSADLAWKKPIVELKTETVFTSSWLRRPDTPETFVAKHVAFKSETKRQRDKETERKRQTNTQTNKHTNK